MIERVDDDGVAVVRLAHGPVNALYLDLLGAITDTFRDLDHGDHTAVVLTGTGKAFCAGVDLWRIVESGQGYVEEFLPALVAAFEAVFTTGKPVVAVLNGHAIAGGCIFAAACDRRIMAAGGVGSASPKCWSGCHSRPPRSRSSGTPLASRCSGT